MRTLAYMRRLCAFAVLALSQACGGEPAEAPDDRVADGPGADTEAAEAERRAEALSNELGALEEQASAAIDAEDRAEAGRVVRRGLERANACGAACDVARGRFVLLRGNLARDGNRIVDARRDYADAMALFRVRSDDRGRFEVFLEEAELEEMQGDYAAAERQLAEAETLLPRIEDDRLRGEYQRRMGRLAFVRVRYPDACALYVEALKSFSADRAMRDKAETLLLLASAEDARGDVPLARRTLEKALAIFVDLGDKGGQASALHRLAGFADRDRQFAKERSLLTKVRALYDELGRRSDAVKVERQLASLPESNE